MLKKASTTKSLNQKTNIMKQFYTSEPLNNKASCKKHMSITAYFLPVLVLLISTLSYASESEGFAFNPDYEIRFHDREAGLYFYERVVPSTEGYILEMHFEVHDNKQGGRYGCEQMNRMIIQDLLGSGFFGEEGLDDPTVDEIEFMEQYKTAFLKYANNVRPYSDLRGFLQSLEIWYAQNCRSMNRLESNPEWYNDLTEYQLVLTNDGMPFRKSYVLENLGLRQNTKLEVYYLGDSVRFNRISEDYGHITASAPITQRVYDPFQINMIVSSLEYYDGFEKDLVFKNLLVDLYGADSEEKGPETSIDHVVSRLSVRGTMFLPLDGKEVEVWAVDLTGFPTTLYHPMLHIYDRYHRRFSILRYYIDKESGNILMAETLRSEDFPVSFFHVE